MNRHRGVTIFETVIACLLMGMAIAIVAQLMIAVARQQQVSRQRAAALQEASNALELLLAAGDEPSAEAGRIGLSTTARRILPGGEIQVARSRAPAGETESDSPVQSERIAVTVRWNAAGSEAAQSLRLVGWRPETKETGP